MLKRISWLDSASMAARIHATNDEGHTTICGHQPILSTIPTMTPEKDEKKCYHFNWKITSDVPRKIHGRSRYCKICFAKGGKNAPWFELT